VSGTDAFQVEGLVLEVLSERTFRLELANGHRLLGFVSRKTRATQADLAPGKKVRLQLSPFDLSQGCILAAS
jgi:translation initiation factor IF-1